MAKPTLNTIIGLLKAALSNKTSADDGKALVYDHTNGVLKLNNVTVDTSAIEDRIETLEILPDEVSGIDSRVTSLEGIPPGTDPRIGDMNQLETESKDTFVDALNEVFQHGNDGKSLLETTIVSRNGEVSKAGLIATFEELAYAIQNLELAVEGIDYNVAFDESIITSVKTGLPSVTENITQMDTSPTTDSVITAKTGAVPFTFLVDTDRYLTITVSGNVMVYYIPTGSVSFFYATSTVLSVSGSYYAYNVTTDTNMGLQTVATTATVVASPNYSVNNIDGGKTKIIIFTSTSKNVVHYSPV
jgi:hypothetical protein